MFHPGSRTGLRRLLRDGLLFVELNLGDGNAVASHLAREVHRVPGVLLEAGEVLVRDGNDLALMYEDVLCARLHAGFRTLGVAHLLPAVLDGSLVRGAAVAVAVLPHPRLLGAPDRRREEYGRGGADEEGSQSLGSLWSSKVRYARCEPAGKQAS